MMLWFGVTGNWLKEEQQVETPIGQTLYWDYYRYVLDHPIENWNCATSILYGANDNLCERDTIDAFVNKIGCKLEVFEAGEHFFYTPEQLEFYSAWLERNMR